VYGFIVIGLDKYTSYLYILIYVWLLGRFDTTFPAPEPPPVALIVIFAFCCVKVIPVPGINLWYGKLRLPPTIAGVPDASRKYMPFV